ncbi:hypothetical protein [uncultured Oxalobacter sp.]|uniref:hypothetical protein n=1 Tax=uncultured Oxalobacter sp. TaxID=337245 RepID=UPI002594EBE8|nr:hypothetical protein [uncultured Oxalobacter sp.]
MPKNYFLAGAFSAGAALAAAGAAGATFSAFTGAFSAGAAFSAFAGATGAFSAAGAAAKAAEANKPEIRIAMTFFIFKFIYFLLKKMQSDWITSFNEPISHPVDFFYDERCNNCNNRLLLHIHFRLKAFFCRYPDLDIQKRIIRVTP